MSHPDLTHGYPKGITYPLNVLTGEINEVGAVTFTYLLIGTLRAENATE